jgi:hypothetical protein
MAKASSGTEARFQVISRTRVATKAQITPMTAACSWLRNTV